MKLPLWWLSFADADGFRGVVIAPGVDMIDAVRATHVAGCSPGGQVVGYPADDPRLAHVPVLMLLRRKELDALLPVLSIQEAEEMGMEL